MKRMRDESGQVAIMAALSLVCILGFVGLATDVGVLLHAKRNLQIAADAAALAGANEIAIDATQIIAAAKAASAQNGYTDGVNSVTVTPTNGPADGPHAGDANYVEAIVTQTQPTFFMRLFNFSSMPVSARAVAFHGANNGSGCLHALNGTDPDTINLQGHFTVDAPGCQVLDNSKANCALDFTGNAGNLTAGSVSVAGTACGHTSDSNPAPVRGPQVSDPLANTYKPLTAAQKGTCGAAPSGSPNSTVTWGSPSGGVTCYSGTISIGNTVNMYPGTYVFTGSLGMQGHGILNGPVPAPSIPTATNGVTIYLAGPSGNMGMNGAGNGNINLTGGSVLYPNVVIYQEPTDTNTVNMEGTPVTALTGIIYLPSAMLELGGNSTTQSLTTDLIVNKLFVFGSATVNISDYSATHNTPLHTFALVE